MQQDYILRIIEQFIQAIASIMRRRKAKDYTEARKLIGTAGRSLLRIDIDLLLLFHPDQIIDHFKDFTHRLETEKCVLAADLFYELALIEEAEKKPEAALRLKTLCLHLYTIAIPAEKQFQTPEYFEKVDQLIQELADQPLSPKVLESLRPYQEFKPLPKDV